MADHNDYFMIYTRLPVRFTKGYHIFTRMFGTSHALESRGGSSIGGALLLEILRYLGSQWLYNNFSGYLVVRHGYEAATHEAEALAMIESEARVVKLIVY